jgi:hypothetical protein
MPDDLEQIRTIKSQALQLLADITTSPKPTYYIDGQSVSWERYLAQLQSTVDWCEARLNANAPFEFQTRGET